MQYQEPVKLSRDNALVKIKSDNVRDVCDGLLSLTFYDSDWGLTQYICVQLAEHSNPSIRQIAVTCIGHIARIHQKIDVEKVAVLFERLINDPAIAGIVEDAISDIRIFTGIDLGKRFRGSSRS